MIKIEQVSIESIFDIHDSIPEFSIVADRNYFEQRLNDRAHLILCAYIDNVAVGYMIAYDRDEDNSFYCWLAGVLPEYRNLGVLSELMNYLINYSKSNGFNKIKIKTKNQFRNMLSFLVKKNFNFVQIETADNINEYAIHLEKSLD